MRHRDVPPDSAGSERAKEFARLAGTRFWPTVVEKARDGFFNGLLTAVQSAGFPVKALFVPLHLSVRAAEFGGTFLCRNWPFFTRIVVLCGRARVVIWTNAVLSGRMTFGSERFVTCGLLGAIFSVHAASSLHPRCLLFRWVSCSPVLVGSCFSQRNYLRIHRDGEVV